MNRGAIRQTTREEAVRRALSMIACVPQPPHGAPSDAGHRPIGYRLEEKNGGRDPFAGHCADWSFGDRRPTADCVGFVLWATGIDRLQPSYKGVSGPWLHCPSLIADADGAKRWCEPVDYWQAIAGDWLLDAGHISMIVRPAMKVPNSPSNEKYDHLVVDCSPRHGFPTGINTGGPWSEKCRVVRYKLYVP